MERFLRYSLEKGRKIRVMLLMDGVLSQKPVTVTGIAEGNVTLLMGGKKKPLTIPLGDILSCDYARGDHGED